MIQFDDHIFQMGWFNHQLARLMNTIQTVVGWPFGMNLNHQSRMSVAGSQEVIILHEHSVAAV